jgi:hypothetical protein
MWHRLNRAADKAWRIGEWMTVFVAMVSLFGSSARRPPRRVWFRRRRTGEAPALAPQSEDPDGGWVLERARRRRHID